MLRVVVLGAAAGGGVPQWNCGCEGCRTARDNGQELQRTQASVAFTGDGEHWFLINASPDLRQQLNATPQLHPKAGALRHTPIAGVILTNSEVDAVAGFTDAVPVTLGRKWTPAMDLLHLSRPKASGSEPERRATTKRGLLFWRAKFDFLL